MTRIPFTNDKKQIRGDFLDLLSETYDSMIDAKLSPEMIVPHLSGMAMAAEWFGLLDHDEVESLTLALLIDTCEA